MSKPSPPNDECYYAEDTYPLNEQMGFFYQVPKALIRKIGTMVKGAKVGTMVATTVRVIMSEMETTTAKQL